MVVVSYYSKEGLTDVIKHCKSRKLSVSTMEEYLRKSKAVVVHIALCLTSGSFTSFIECSLSLWKEDFYLWKRVFLSPHRWLQVYSVLKARRSEMNDFALTVHADLTLSQVFFQAEKQYSSKECFYKMPPSFTKMLQTRKKRRLVLRIQNEYCSEHWFFLSYSFSDTYFQVSSYWAMFWLTPTF